jgi:predicted SprT family Zn-dependent metalloprotease
VISAALSRRARPLLRKWGLVWGIPNLADTISLRIDQRLRRSWAICRPQRDRISFHHRVTSLPTAAFAEVLCHEAAHVAAFRLYGRKVRPHGSQWEALLQVVGRPASLRRKIDGAIGKKSPTASELYRYMHVCPVCQFVRFARKPVTQWRCRNCVTNGLPGQLEIVDNPRWTQRVA